MQGRTSGRDPLRVVLDAGLRLPATAVMLRQESSAPTWIFCARGADKKKHSRLEQAGAVVKPVSVLSRGRLDLKAVLTELGRNHITTVLVEGGSKVHGSFLQEGLADQVLLFVAPVFLGEQGVPLVSFSGKDRTEVFSQMKIKGTRRYGPAR